MRTPHRGSRATKTWLSRSDVARLLDVAPVTIGRWASEGKLPYATTLGGQRRFRRADVLQLVDRLVNVTTFRAPAKPPRHR
jgi:excisionase family DNA binding protein